MIPDSSAVWAAHGDCLRAFIGRRLRRPADVDDASQDLFLRIHRALSADPEPDRLEPWLFGIARHAIADHERARSRPIPPPRPADPLDPEAEVARWLRPLAQGLSAEDREILSHAAFKGRDDREVAARLVLTLTAAKSRLRRARAARLRRRLESCCRFELDARRRVAAWSHRDRAGQGHCS